MMNRKSISKFVVSIAVLSFVFVCFTIGALAEATHTTTTSYDLSTNMLQVESTVTGVAPEEEVTYLAYTGDGPTAPNGEIVYIDQDTVKADEDELTFNYSTTNDKGIGAVVMFGAMNTTVINPATAGDDNTLAPYDLTVTITGNGKVFAHGQTLSASSTIKVGQNFDISLVPDYAYTGSAVLTDSNDVTTNIIDTLSVTDNAGNLTLVVTFEEVTQPTIEQYTPSELHGGKAFARQIDADPTKNQTTSFGKVVTSTEVNVEYGILFSENQAAINARVDGDDGSGIDEYSTPYDDTKVYKFKATSKGTGGLFAVVLIDGGANIITSEKAFQTRTYINNYGVYTYGAVTTITD